MHLLDQLLHPYKFYGRDMSGILFFIFASCEPLTQKETMSILIMFKAAIELVSIDFPAISPNSWKQTSTGFLHRHCLSDINVILTANTTLTKQCIRIPTRCGSDVNHLSIKHLIEGYSDSQLNSCFINSLPQIAFCPYTVLTGLFAGGGGYSNLQCVHMRDHRNAKKGFFFFLDWMLIV